MEKRAPDECEVGDHFPDLENGTEPHGFAEDNLAMFHPVAPSAGEMLESGMNEWEQETWLFRREKSADGTGDVWFRIK